MEIIDVKQGSEEWLEIRLSYCTASEAPIMMGESPFMTRSKLLDIKKGWKTNPDSEFKKSLFRKGHENEDAARILAEEYFFESFVPVVGGIIIDGIRLLASFDGLGLNKIPWENKSPNRILTENVRNGVLEPNYEWQLEQQALVAGSDFVHFSVSDGTEENTVFMVYESKPHKQKQLISGWKQFLIDLDNHELVVKKESVMASHQENLPVIFVKIEGNLVDSNVVDFLEKIRFLAANEIGRPLECDQDFVDKISLVKAVEKTEKEVNRQIDEIQNGQGQITDFIRVAKEASSLLRSIRLDGTKLIANEKSRIKNDLIAKSQLKINEFEKELDQRLKPHSTVRDFVKISVDIAGAIRGKKNLDNMKNTIDSTIANFKAETNLIIDNIVNNVKIIKENDGGFVFLFNDWRSWVSGTPESVLATTKQRVFVHQESERRRLDIEREKIRLEFDREQNGIAAIAQMKKVREEAAAAEAAAAEAAAAEAAAAKKLVQKVREEFAEKTRMVEAAKKKQEKIEEDCLSKDGRFHTIYVPHIIRWESSAGEKGSWVNSVGEFLDFDPDKLEKR